VSLSRWPAASVAHYPGPGCPNSSIDHAWKWKGASPQVNKHYCKSTTSEAHISIKAHRHRSTCSLKIGKRSPHGHSLLQFHKRKPHGHKGASPQVNKHLANRQANPTWPLLSAWLKTNVIVALLFSLCIHTYIYTCVYI